MTTIASPRPSLSISSRRTSTSTDTIARSDSISRQPGGQRRNRAALREFYGLKNVQTQAESADSTDTLPAEGSSPRSEIDGENFDADRYVQDLFEREGLEGVLRVEAGLLKDIRGFDGERKALVYDNYSKLIGATDTIRKMRGNMTPLRPTFHTLTPAISHIAETAASLSGIDGKAASARNDAMKIEQERQLVKRVLDSPERLRRLVNESRREEAERDWREIAAVLDVWNGVPGTAEIRSECEGIVGLAIS